MPQATNDEMSITKSQMFALLPNLPLVSPKPCVDLDTKYLCQTSISKCNSTITGRSSTPCKLSDCSQHTPLLRREDHDPFKGQTTSNLDVFKTLVETLYEKVNTMEESIQYLRQEIEHKNTTIDRLLDVITKGTMKQNTDTYNENIDKYNDRVSSYNTTPIKLCDKNVTRRRKKSHQDKPTSVETAYEMITSDTPDEQISFIAPDSSEVTEGSLQQQQGPSIEEQMMEYKSAKHSKFLSTNEGIAWKKRQDSTPAGEIYTEADMDVLNNMYREYEEHDDEH